MRASGSRRRKLVLHWLNGANLVVQEIDLPPAFQFAQARLADDSFGKAADERLDREPPLRRCRDD